MRNKIKSFWRMLFILPIIFIYLFINIFNTAFWYSDKYWYDEISPYLIVDVNDVNNPIYYNMPSYINPKNVWSSFSSYWCNKNIKTDRDLYKPSFWVNLLTCTWNVQNTIKEMLKLAKVVNMAQVYGQIITDTTIPRYYLISHEIEITQADIDAWRISISGQDVIYNSNDDIHLMYIFDPDMKKGTLENMYTQANLQHNPSLTFSAYNLDSWRITDNLLWSWVYTIEHFLWSKYTSNNGSTLKTTSYDGLPLYKLTYYQQPFLNIWDWVKYCNWYNITSADYFDLYFWNNLIPFQSTDSSSDLDSNRDNAWPLWAWCPWTSWLRVNKTIWGWLLNGSIPLTYWIIGGTYRNSIAKIYNGERSYYAPFNPLSTEWEIWELRTKKVWVIDNVRNFDPSIHSTNTDKINSLVWKKKKIYFLVKSNLLFFNFNTVEDGSGTNVDFTDWNCLVEACESHNDFLIWFDPLHTWWNTYNNHKLVPDINAINTWTTSADYDTISLIYQLLFNWYNNLGWYRYEWEWNMYVAYSKNNEIYNMSSSWFVVDPLKYNKTDTTKQEKMKYRGIHIPLTASQWYVVNEFSWTTLDESWDTLAIASRAVINSYGEDLTRFLFARNSDADSWTQTSFTADTNRDENVWYKVFSKNSLNNDIKLYKLYTPNPTDPNNTESYIKNIPWFKTNFSVANNTTNCWSTYDISPLNNVWTILWPNESSTTCWDAWAEILRLSWNTWDYIKLAIAEGYQQWIEWIVQDLSLNKSSAKWLYINQIFENVNDSDVRNQIFTNSNFLENIWDPVIQCNLWIYKLPVISSKLTDYKSWRSGNLNLFNIWEYALDTELFENNTNPLFDYTLINKLVDNTYTITEYNNYITNYFTTQTWDNYTLGSSKWNVWEKWFISYYCNNLPRDKKYIIWVITDNLQYEPDTSSWFFVWDTELTQFKSLNTFTTDTKISFSQNNILWYNFDWTWKLIEDRWTTPLNVTKDNSLSPYIYDYMYYQEPNTADFIWEMPTLWFDTNKVTDTDHVKWAMEFTITSDTEWHYNELSLVLYDTDQDEIVQSLFHYIKAETIESPIQITNVTKYEQTVSEWYNHVDIGFDWVDGINPYWVSFEITNTTWSDMITPSSAPIWWNNQFIISSLTDRLLKWDWNATTISTQCAWDTEYTCISNSTDYWNTHQNVKILLSQLELAWSVQIIKTDLSGTKTTYNAVAWNTPIAWNFTYKFVDTVDDKFLIISFPSDENVIRANTSYEIRLSIPDWSFVWTWFWENLLWWNTNAITLIPAIIYDNTTTWWLLYNWDLWLKSGLNLSWFYSKLKVLGTSWSCNSLISNIANPEWYNTNATLSVYLSEDAAQTNWTTCSDPNVVCLYNFSWKIASANFWYTTSSYSWPNFVWNDTANIWDNYSLLVEVTNQATNSSETDASEIEILNNAMEVDTTISFDADFNPTKWISLITKNPDADFLMWSSIVNNTSKTITLDWVYWPNMLIYDTNWTDPDTWNSRGLTTTYWSWSNPLLEWGRTNLLAFQTTTPSLFVRSAWWAWLLDEDKTYYAWIYGQFTTNKKPSALVTLEFWTENVPVELQNQTCQIQVNDFPTVKACEYIPPVLDDLDITTWVIDDYRANVFDDFMSEDNSIAWDINSCESGSPTYDALSIEYQHYMQDVDNNLTGWIIYHTDISNDSECWEANYTIANWKALDVFFSIPWRSNIFWKCTVNIDDLWISAANVVLDPNGVYINDIELDAWESKDIYIWCALQAQTPDCSTDNITDANIELTHPFWTSTSNPVEFKQCMLPTLNITQPAKVLDWNTSNDSIPEEYSTAYPFEMIQCWVLENNWRVSYTGWCWLTDDRYKDIQIRWHRWTSFDDKAEWRDFYQWLVWLPIAMVSWNDTWTYVEWDLNTANLVDVLDSEFDPTVNIFNDPAWELRGEWSYFEIINNEPTLINVILEPGAWNCVWNICTSKLLSSAIWKDPIVTNQQMVDDWIYENPDEHTAILHREEIDESSKQWNISWIWHRENVIFEATIENPAVNTFYWLWALNFDFRLWTQADIFDEIDTTEANIWSSLIIKWFDPTWEWETLNTWETKSYRWYFLLDPTLNSIPNPYSIPTKVWNAVKQSYGYPELMFWDASSCNYKLWFSRWKVEIEDNPIVIEDFEFEDIIDNPWSTNQHLPWDIINLNIDITNTNPSREFENVFIDMKFNDNTTLTDPNLELKLNDVFSIDWTLTAKFDPYYWIQLYDVPLQWVSCWLNNTRMICIFNNGMPTETTQNIEIPLRIDISSSFYDNLKASSIEEKYWYPIIIESIRYWTPDLNSITHPTKWDIVYYTSDLNTLPSGWELWDMNDNDINDPNNTLISVSPTDWKYNFYIGIPYVNITNEIINNSIWHFSPWDVITFKTKVESRSKAYIRDLIFNQDLFKLDLRSDYIDTEILQISYLADKTNFNTTSRIVDLEILNTDADTSNDVDTTSIDIIKIQNDVTWLLEYDLLWTNLVLYSDWDDYWYLEWTTDPLNTSWWNIEIETKVKIIGLKSNKFPQIWCDSSWLSGCDRWMNEWENPKEEYQVWYADIPYVWSWRDAEAENAYYVYFPILKSILFQQDGDSYIPTPWSNLIKWLINSENTEVVYRVDNFLPTSYDAASNGIWKARNSTAHIRLPVWVTYVPNTFNKIDNLQDSFPYWTETLIADPTITEVSDYSVLENSWQYSFEHNFLNSSSGWTKIDRTDNLNYNVLKWTPFSFSFFNNSYNNFRVTDDWVLALWYKTWDAWLAEWQFYTDKQTGTIVVSWTSTGVTVKFSKITWWVLLPLWTEYVNVDWENSISNWIDEVFIKANTEIELIAWDIVNFSQWMEWVDVSDRSQLDIFWTNVLYSNMAFEWYKLISPSFIKLDTSDKDDRGHWVYEKKFVSGWNIIAIWYQWYWYVEWTTKEVEYWVILYSSTNYNSIKFTYWDIDSTLNIPVVNWISNWVSVLYSPKDWELLQDLSNINDIYFDASNIYQELVFDVWYPANPLDPVVDDFIDYEERETIAPYLFINKPNSSVAFKFNVKIRSDDTICQREYTESIWGSTLRWNRVTSSQVDFDDVDSFCFSAEKPWMAILENSSYAKWWYKTSQSSCVVQHLSIMWFSAVSVWWNDSTTNNCWLTYNTKVKEKELSLDNISPYLILWDFKSVVDTRPIDTNELVANQSIVFDTPSSIIIINSEWSHNINTLIPDFQALWLDYATEKNIYLYGYSTSNNKSYLIYSWNNWETWKIIQEFSSKRIDKVFVKDSDIQIFFSDWTFKRNTEGWIWLWTDGILVNYSKINEIKFRTNKSWFIIWNNWSFWKTNNSWKSFEYFNFKDLYSLQTWENLNSIDIYWSNEIWISTNKWNILYSNDSWETFSKKTTGSTPEVNKATFEDDTLLFINWVRNNFVWTKDNNIDITNNKSIKFNNINQYPYNGMIISKEQFKTIDYTWIIPNLSSYLKVIDWYNIPLWDFDIEVYVSDKQNTWNISKIYLIDNYWNKLILNIEDNIRNLWIDNISNWFMKTHFEVRWLSGSDYAFDIVSNNPNNFENIIQYYIETDKVFNNTNQDFVWLSNIKFAPVDNLINNININDFSIDIWWANYLNKLFSNKLLTLNSWNISLSEFVKSDNKIKWFLLIDIYVEDPSSDFISMIELWNDNTKKITWNNPLNYISGWVLNEWWNTLNLPFDNTNDTNIVYTNWWDISLGNIDFIEFSKENISSQNQSYAIDNIRFTDSEATNFKYVKFFNSKNWVSFDEDKSYITTDNTIWWVNNTFKWDNTFFEFIEMKKIRWREIYWLVKTDSWWWSYYSLDKWNNSNLYLSWSNIDLLYFDILDYDLWIALSENNTLYRMSLLTTWWL